MRPEMVGKPISEMIVLPTAFRGLSGKVEVPPSKSLTQRAILAAALAGPGSRVLQPLVAEDPQILQQALEVLGYGFRRDGQWLEVTSRHDVASGELFFGNNGTALRLLLPQAALTPGRWRFDGSPRLRKRPLWPLLRALQGMGAELIPMTSNGQALPLEVRGRPLQGDNVILDASLSSQFVSALMFAGVRLAGGLKLSLTSPPPSRPYVRLTQEVLRAFGAEVEVGELSVKVEGPLVPASYEVEGDWSAAAFPLAAVAVAGGEVEVVRVSPTSNQGDAVCLQLLQEVGCRGERTARGVRVLGPGRRPLVANLQDTPDLFPPLAVVVAVLGGKLFGLATLAGKESPRLEVMGQHLSALGFDVSWGDDWFLASGRQHPVVPEQALDPASDHRVAMALAVAGLVRPGLKLANPQCVAKSWPGFFHAWFSLVSS